ncbi:MAG TPA: hypothetical protein VKR58_06060 [Aquella sp.]|nr:hypothetical protein [Aquella sp.]
MFGRREILENRSEEPESSEDMQYELIYDAPDEMFHLYVLGQDRPCSTLSTEYMIKLILRDRDGSL